MNNGNIAQKRQFKADLLRFTSENKISMWWYSFSKNLIFLILLVSIFGMMTIFTSINQTFGGMNTPQKIFLCGNIIFEIAMDLTKFMLWLAMKNYFESSIKFSKVIAILSVVFVAVISILYFWNYAELVSNTFLPALFNLAIFVPTFFYLKKCQPVFEEVRRLKAAMGK